MSEGFGMFLSYLIQFGITIVYALFQKRMRTPNGLREPLLRFSFKKVNPAITLWGVIMVAATSLVIEPVLLLFPDVYMDLLSKMMGMGGWAMLTTIVLAPLFEEALFRGILQESLTNKYGALRGILIASAVFGVVHVIPQQVVNAFFVGLILGYIYYKTRSLIPVIVIHCINNAVSSFTWVLNGGKVELSTREMIGNDTLYAVIYAVACVIFLIALVSIARVFRRDSLSRQALLENTPADAGKVPPADNINAE